MGKLDGKVCRGCYKMVCRCGPRQGRSRTINQRYPWKDPSNDESLSSHGLKANRTSFKEKYGSYEKLDTTSRRKWMDCNNGPRRRRINKVRYK